MHQLPSSDDERRQELASITTELYRAGLITASGGNVSVRCAGRPDAVWITPSGKFKGALDPNDMVLIDLYGQKIDGPGKPSVESVYHASVMRLRPEINAVVHSHAPLATAFALCDLEMVPVTAEAVLLRDFPTISFYIGGTKELADAVVKHLGDGKTYGAFLRQHGLVTLGVTLRKAADLTLMVEHTCRILIACKMMGCEPSQIPEEMIPRLLRHAEGII